MFGFQQRRKLANSLEELAESTDEVMKLKQALARMMGISLEKGPKAVTILRAMAEGEYEPDLEALERIATIVEVQTRCIQGLNDFYRGLLDMANEMNLDHRAGIEPDFDAKRD